MKSGIPVLTLVGTVIKSCYILRGQPSMFQVLSYSVPEVVCLIYFFYVLMVVDYNQYFSFWHLRFFLRRRLTTLQWMAIVLLTVGTTTSQVVLLFWKSDSSSGLPLCHSSVKPNNSRMKVLFSFLFFWFTGICYFRTITLHNPWGLNMYFYSKFSRQLLISK